MKKNRKQPKGEKTLLKILRTQKAGMTKTQQNKMEIKEFKRMR